MAGRDARHLPFVYMITAPPLTSAEREKWTSQFESHLADRLQWAIAHVREQRPKPARLKPYGDSLIALLRQARSYPQLAQPIVELILALHPLPERWGQWTAWDEMLRVGAAIAANHFWQRRQADLLAYRAQLLWLCNRCEEAIAVARDALPLAESLAALLPLGMAGAALVNALSALGQVEEARELLTNLLKQTAVLHPTTPKADYATAMLSLEHSQALMLRRQGKQKEATAVTRRMLKRVAGNPSLSPYQVGDIYVELATMTWASGDYPAAVQALQEAIRLFEQVEDTVAAVFARGNLGLVYWSMARYDLAERNMRACIAFCEQVNARWRLVSDVGNLALVYLGQGNLHAALHYVDRHLDLAQRQGHTWETSRAHLNRGAILVYLQEYESAHQELEKSLARVTQENRQELIASVKIDLSLCLAGLGKEALAQQLARNAYAMAQEMSFPALKIIALRNLARYGNRAERRQHLQRALSLARQHHRSFDEAGCLLSLISLTKNDAKQVDYWQQAAALLQKMGAVAWLKQHSRRNPPFLALML